MSNILKKALITIILIISIMNNIMPIVSFAADSQVNIEDITNTVVNVAGGIVSIAYWDKRILVTAIAFIVNTLFGAIVDMGGASNIIGSFSVQNIFFNDCALFDVNFFDINNPDIAGSAVYDLRVAVAQWFYIMRFIAVCILLIILIYVGIRMAIASVAEDRAKYKKMLFDWICSLALVFVLQYIAMFTIAANSALVNVLKIILTQGGSPINLGDILAKIGWNAILGVGINAIASVAVYALIIFQTLGYIIVYINRMLKIAFLLIVSPLISITYAIDKMGDGKAQALNNWLKEFVFTILIQPFHCLIFLIFVKIAFELLVPSNVTDVFESFAGSNQLANGILAILCIKFIKDAETIVKKIFGLDQASDNGTSLAAGLAISAAAFSKVQGAGTRARGLVNSAKNNKFLNAVASDIKGSKWAGKLKNSKIGTAFTDKKNAAMKGISNLKGKINNNKAIKGFKKAWGSDKMKFMRARGRNSLASAVGISAGLARYASGAGALEAIGAGSAAQQFASGYLNSSTGTISNQNADSVSKLAENGQKDNEEKKKDLKNSQEQLKEVQDNLKQTTENLEDTNENLEKNENELRENGINPDELDNSESIDSKIEELEEESKKSSSRMKEYRDAGSDEQFAQERSNRSHIIGKISSLKERKKLLERKEELEDEKFNLEEQEEELQDKCTYLQDEIGDTEAAMAAGESPEAMSNYQSSIEMAGDMGKFDKSKSKQYESIRREIEKALESIGLGSRTDFVMNQIEKEVELNPGTFNLDATLQRCLGNNIGNNQEVRKATRRLENFQHHSNVYNNIKTAKALNIKDQTLAKRTHAAVNVNKMIKGGENDEE